MRRERSNIDVEDSETVDETRAGNLGRLLARAALQHAMGPRLRDYDTGPQVIQIVVPHADWVTPVRDAWRSYVKAGRAQTKFKSGKPTDVSSKRWLDVPQDPRSSTIHEGYMQRALDGGVQVLIITPVPLPPMQAALPDKVFVMEPPRWSDFKRGLTALVGGGGTWPPQPAPEILVKLTPSVLRLSIRRDEGGGAVLERAVRLAGVSVRATAKGHGPTGFARVPGMGKALEWGRELAKDIADYKVGRLTWSEVDRGVLLSGPPGCGKTAFAKALAEEVGVPLIMGSHSQWQAAGHQGDMLKAMRATFAEARAAAPCILFIDEIDGFPDREKVGSDHREYVRQVVNALLAEMDGAVSREGVVVVGACNNPDVLDPALVRAGRLDRHIEIGLPDATGLVEVLRVHLNGELAEKNLTMVGRFGVGHSGAQAEQWVRDARRDARQENREVTVFDLLRAVWQSRKMKLEPASSVIH